MAVDLKAKPFDLNDEQIQWVEDTIASMTLDEKLGQLFILLKAIPGVHEDYIKSTVEQFHQGGVRWQMTGDKQATWEQNTLYQKYSKVPVLIAGNCDDGGNGVLPEGTFIATAAEASAADDDSTAYHIGYVAGKEASAVGVNWMFNPVADVYRNWRNTIVNTRSFGSDTDKVIQNVRAYIRGIKDANPNMACTLKHFPGDGWDELDPHISPAYNEDIMPASLSPELLQDLLRGELGFNGVIVSDASHMIGMAGRMKREDAVPACIAAGCDMFLFANDIAEDLCYMKAGYEKGIITEERLSDALHRILGLKAHLHLNEEAVRYPDHALLDKVGLPEYHEYAREAADKGVTLVKDTRHLIPWNVREKKRALLIYAPSIPNSKGYNGDPLRKTITEELERVCFEVTQQPNFWELEVENGVSPMNFVKMMGHQTRQSFIDSYDVIFVFIYIKGYAQKNVERMSWSSGHSCEMPWYTEEVPTIGVSLNYTNHLVDAANIHTFINGYGPNIENVRAVCEKIVGKSEFKGTADPTVWCGRWDTRL